MKYLLSILGVIFCGFLMLVSSENGFADLVHIGYYFDVISILLMVVIVVPTLLSSGLWKDFGNAFRLTLGKKEAKSVVELRRAKEATRLGSRVFLGAGVFITAFTLIYVLMISDIKIMQYNAAVGLIDMVYGAIGYLLLLPIRSRLEVKLIEFMHGENLTVEEIVQKES